MAITANKDFIINQGDRIKYDAATLEIIVQPFIMAQPDGSFTLNIEMRILDVETKQQVGAKGFSISQQDLIADEPQIANRIAAILTACEKFVRKELESINPQIQFTR